MTDYGRGPGSEPWHPEDPLYGDQGWGAQQAVDGQAPYDGQQQYPQQHQQPHQQGQGQYGGEQGPYQQQYAPQQQPQPQQPEPQQYGQPQQGIPGQQGGLQHNGQPQQPYPPQQQYGQPQQYQDPQQYGGGPGYNDPQQYGGQPQYHDPGYNDSQHGGGWDTGQQAAMPYGGPDPYGGQQGGYDPNAGYYGSPEGYQQQQQPQQQQHPQQQPQHQPPPEQHPSDPHSVPGPRVAGPENDWEAEPEEEKHPFFTGEDGPGAGLRGRDDDEDDEYDDPDDSRRGSGERRGSKPKKGRSGRACLVLAVVFVGAVGGIGYVGYNFYQDRFGPPPDFSGAGTGSVQVVVPDGASGLDIAGLLVKNGVVKSQGAFVEAQKKNPKGNAIQAGVYVMRKAMPAASAVDLMLDPKSRNNLIIGEGWRNAKVYDLIDKRLGVPSGTTSDVAHKDYKTLGLPDWALNHAHVKDPLEGFLYPSSYPVAKGQKPADVLKEMVAFSSKKYENLDLDAQAKEFHLDGPWQVITVASLVQAEGKTSDDFRKMAEVVYNRLKPTNTETNQKLQFDSTFNYLKGQSNIKISESEITTNMDLYNTYTHKGLPPGPISNPGDDALKATLDPTSDGWMYFVATDGMNETEFAKNSADFERLKQKFNDSVGN
ncbi:hypothetical protein QR77_05255 [Streptomyces sp. 150FB]|uniref:endolytic transglycosylase MltG n=1 Tax=Streptomyces sp. 150FB TaxID=1576605 RepID=UPI0005893C74|nr:endolytic transglycosylase MltG [Streptomyces sp. 150FB]KIF73535.1 hypothetical protein QR77_05255 [Streptomyces sp. 150FB]